MFALTSKLWWPLYRDLFDLGTWKLAQICLLYRAAWIQNLVKIWGVMVNSTGRFFLEWPIYCCIPRNWQGYLWTILYSTAQSHLKKIVLPDSGAESPRGMLAGLGTTGRRARSGWTPFWERLAKEPARDERRSARNWQTARAGCYIFQTFKYYVLYCIWRSCYIPLQTPIFKLYFLHFSATHLLWCPCSGRFCSGGTARNLHLQCLAKQWIMQRTRVRAKIRELNVDWSIWKENKCCYWMEFQRRLWAY